MKEYGVSNSWIKQLTIDLDKYWKPLCLRKYVPYPYCVLNFSNNGDVLKLSSVGLMRFVSKFCLKDPKYSIFSPWTTRERERRRSFCRPSTPPHAAAFTQTRLSPVANEATTGGLASNEAWTAELEHREDNAHRSIFPAKNRPSGTSRIVMSSPSILHRPLTLTHLRPPSIPSSHDGGPKRGRDGRASADQARRRTPLPPLRRVSPRLSPVANEATADGLASNEARTAELERCEDNAHRGIFPAKNQPSSVVSTHRLYVSNRHELAVNSPSATDVNSLSVSTFPFWQFLFP
ncbi:hypothetical protein PanWU01x14_052490 [Parasponia andersonii]|uniref:Uncharacterized protein n=1 Tax=Parasponia andersonii TaxID=3476 RepID=A0A2P5DMB1_PARAD|nr:hypothetical protein PanWU01x14_052490 [Parasponia andersonii]